MSYLQWAQLALPRSGFFQLRKLPHGSSCPAGASTPAALSLHLWGLPLTETTGAPTADIEAAGAGAVRGEGRGALR